MRDMFGTGKADMFCGLRDQLSEVDTRGISIMQNKRDKIEKCQINDQVYKSFDAVEREQQKKEAMIA